MFHPFPRFDDGDDGSGGIVFRDVLFLTLAGFILVLLLVLPHLNPEGREEEAEPPGNVIIEITWEDGWDTDVDLWVEAPGDVPVGYSNLGGKIFNLLRDDLGMSGDTTDTNFEIAVSRGIVPGEYTVNVHLFRNDEDAWPVPVEAAVRVKLPNKQSRKILSTKEPMILANLGEEMTVFRFKLTKDGDLVQGSVHHLFRALRSQTL